MAASRKKRVLDEDAQREVCAMITVGCSRAAAARLIGCTSNAIAGLAGRDELFGERLQRAEMKREFGPLAKIHALSEKNWRAAAWVLERLRPQDYAARKPAVITPEQMLQIGEMFKQSLERHIQNPAEKESFVERFIEVLQKFEQQSETAAERKNS